MFEQRRDEALAVAAEWQELIDDLGSDDRDDGSWPPAALGTDLRGKIRKANGGVRQAILDASPPGNQPYSIADVMAMFPGLNQGTVQSTVSRMKSAGELEAAGLGKFRTVIMYGGGMAASGPGSVP